MVHDKMYTRLLSHVLVLINTVRFLRNRMKRNGTNGRKKDEKWKDPFDRFVFVCTKQNAKFILAPTVVMSLPQMKCSYTVTLLINYRGHHPVWKGHN